jgi:hypothetical protein
MMFITGCRSVGKPASASFASVEIKGKTVAQIHDATIEVFRKDGFAVTAEQATKFVFDKEGSRMQKFARGDWYEGAPVYERVRVEIVNLGEGTYRLQCTASMVRDKGSFFEDETKLLNIRGRPYQNLLEKIVKQLK